MKDWPQTVTELTSHLRNLRGGAPEVMKAFSNIAYGLSLPKIPSGPDSHRKTESLHH